MKQSDLIKIIRWQAIEDQKAAMFCVTELDVILHFCQFQMTIVKLPLNL